MKRMFRFLSICFAICLLTACGKSLEAQISEQLDLGQRYLLEMNYDEAIVAFEKVIKLDEKNAAAYSGLGQACEAKAESLYAEDRDEARKLYRYAARAYEIVLELDPENSENEARLFSIYLKTNEYGKFDQVFGTGEDGNWIGEEIETLVSLCERGDEEDIVSFFQENTWMIDEMYEIMETLDRDIWPVVIEEEDGRGLGFYKESGTYDPFYWGIYYGDYRNGKREGDGIWVVPLVREEIIYAEGEWENDKPNGHQLEKEYSEDQVGVMEGTVEDGLWDGHVSEYNDGETIHYSFTSGRYDILYEDNYNGSVVYVVAETGNGGIVHVKRKDDLMGILGFADWLY